jgi:methyl coenzyme M reductase subunit D
MSISTYAELQTAVGDWMHRADLTAKIPDFIKLGETKLNTELRVMSMENVDSISTSTTTRFGTLPTGFMEAIDLALYADNYPQTLTQVPLSEINSRATDVTTQPRFYAISTSIVFDVVSDEVYTCSLRYLKRLDIATDLTNTVLTNHPNVYLFSALLYAGIYTKDKSMIADYAQLLSDAIDKANRLDGRTRGKARLRTELGNSQRGDILSGDNW